MGPRNTLRHLRREARGSRGRLAFIVASLAVGVGAVVAVAGFSEGLQNGVRREARSLLAADLTVRGRQPIPAEIHQAIDRLPGTRRTEVREMLTLVAPLGQPTRAPTSTARSLLVELKSVAGTYPFYGDLQLEPAGDLASLLTPETAVVAPEVLSRLGVERGDRLKIGAAEFEIAAVVRKEPDRVAGAFSMGPRLFLSGEGLRRAELEQVGSLVVHRTLVALPPDLADQVDTVAESLKEALDGNIHYTVETYREAQPALRRGLQRMDRYLGLAALLSLLIGGVGVAQTVRSWIAGRLDSIAILRCLGYQPRQIVGLYLGQVAALALLGSLAGAALGIGVQLIAVQFLAGVLPVEHLDPWQPFALLRGLALGLGTGLIFGLPPILEARRVPPIRVLRRDAEPLPPGRRVRLALATFVAVGIFALAAWQSTSLVAGALFTAGLLLTTGLLWLAAGRLMKIAGRPRGTRGRLWWRHGLASLVRPGSSTRGAVVALGIGILVVLAMALVERRLSAQLDQDLPKEAPTTILLDIQPDQWTDLESLLLSQEAENMTSVPVINARLASIDGRPVDEIAEEVDEERRNSRWALRREQRITYLTADQLPKGNRVISGSLWDDPETLELSLEEEFAEMLGVGLGSKMVFDVQGVPVELTVTSIRSVDWSTFGMNFYLIAEPAALIDAPQQRVASFRVPKRLEQTVQDNVVRAFPNVTAIQIREVLEKVTEMLRRLGLGVQLLGWLTVAAGLAILAGAVSADAVRRGREVALLKTLGMTRRQVALAFATEYALVGLVAGAIGSLGAGALAWGVVTQGMDVTWRFEPLVFLTALLGAIVLAVVAGLASSLPALRQRPVEVLRSAG